MLPIILFYAWIVLRHIHHIEIHSHNIHNILYLSHIHYKFNNNYRLLSKIADVDTSYSNNNVVIGLGYLPYSYNCIFYRKSKNTHCTLHCIYLILIY
jgi:hypothetical protein